jgi:hypothetical protein
MSPQKNTDRSEKNRTRTSIRFTSGGSLSEEEFKEGIKSAEKGPLYTVQESMKRFEEWLKQR